MSDKNVDVDRAIASVGGEKWLYHSFKPVLTTTAGTGSEALFFYNELGEPEYAAAHLQLSPPSTFASSEDEYLEDAAYPEAHPNETWFEIPAPEDHTSRFIVPIAPLPVSVEPVLAEPVFAEPARVGPAQAVAAPASASLIAAPAPRPAFAAPPVVAAKPPVYVPFLPSALPQASVQTSAQLYRPAERPPERRAERSMELPVSRSQVAAGVNSTPQPAAPQPVAPQSAAPVTAPVPMMPRTPLAAMPPASASEWPAVPVPPASVPMALSPAIAQRPAAVPLSPPPVVAAPPLFEPAYRPAPPPQRAPASGTQGTLRASPAQAAPTPYPQPFGTLADMYARLARAEQAAAAPALSPLVPAVEVDEQKMFRRL